MGGGVGCFWRDLTEVGYFLFFSPIFCFLKYDLNSDMQRERLYLDE